MKTPSIDCRPTATSEVTELHLTFCVVSNTLTVSDVRDKKFAHLVFLHSNFYGFDIIEVSQLVLFVQLWFDVRSSTALQSPDKTKSSNNLEPLYTTRIVDDFCSSLYSGLDFVRSGAY